MQFLRYFEFTLTFLFVLETLQKKVGSKNGKAKLDKEEIYLVQHITFYF